MRGWRPLSRAMLLGFVRDRGAMFFTILFPLLLLLLIGGLFADQGTQRAVVLKVGPVAPLDDLSSQARAEVDAVLSVAAADDLDAAVRAVRRGDAAAAVTQHGDDVVLYYSAIDPVRAGTVRGTLEALLRQATVAGGATGDDPTGGLARLTLDPRQVEDQALKTIQYLTPGLLGWAIASGAAFGGALTLVSWRQRMILRRLQLAPVRTSAVVFSRVGVSVVLALVQTAVFLGVGALPYFGLTLSDGWWASLPVIIAGTLAFLSIGLVAGAVASTEEAANVGVNVLILPMAFLSGAFFPLDTAPGWLTTVAQVFPLRHLVTGMQDVMVRGNGPASVLPEVGILLAFAAVLSFVAVRIFRFEAR